MLRRHFISTLAAASVVPGISFAQGKPIRLVVPFPPGGATDITARVLGEPLGKILQQPVVIDNRAGAGGSIGMAELARATPDGLTFGVATLSTHGVNPAVYQKLPYDPIKGFRRRDRAGEGARRDRHQPVRAAGRQLRGAGEVPEGQPRQGVVRDAGQRHHRPHVGRAVQEQHRNLDGAHPLPRCGPGHQRRARGPGAGVLRPGGLVAAAS